MARPDRWPVVVAGAATALVVALTRHRIGEKSLWYDEAYSVGLVDRSLGDALWRISHWELNQSPYYLALLVWHELGDSEALLRALSAGFAILTVPVVFLLGRRLVDGWTGAIAAAVVAGHSLVVQWGQQVRGYTLATLLVAVATLLLVEAVERPSTARGIAYGAVAAVTAYSHLVAGLVIATHAVSLLALRPVPLRFARVAAITGAVLSAPLAWYVLTREGDPLAYVREPSRRELGQTFSDLAGGRDGQRWVLGALAVAGALALLARARRERWGTTAAWRAALPVACFAVPVLAVLASTYTVKPLLVTRFLVVVVPALALLVAAGIRRLPLPLGAAAVAAVTFVSALGIQDWYDAGDYEDWRGAVNHVEASAAPGDEVVVLPPRAVHAVRYYGPDLRTVSPSGADDLAGRGLWLVERRTLGDERVPPELARALAEEYRLVEERSFTYLRVRRFERTG